MNLQRFFTTTLLAGAALTVPATADLLYFHGNMDGSQGPSPTGSSATGDITWLMDTVANTVDYTCTSSPGLVLTNAHIHGPATPSQNAPQMHAINFPLPTTATWFFDDADELDIINGLTYTNLHTGAFPAGEIRSQNLLTARVYCSGDGSATTCPCSNPGGAGEGCANTGGNGGRLAPFGSASATVDDMTFNASQLLPGAPALLFSGTTDVAGGNGLPFGGGLRCAGGTIRRMGVRIPNGAGMASWGRGLAAGGAWSAGDRRFFQVWYRDSANQPCGGGFNVTNGLDITFN